MDIAVKNPQEAGLKRIDKITEEKFLQLVAITVKKYRSVKIALDTRSPKKGKFEGQGSDANCGKFNGLDCRSQTRRL